MGRDGGPARGARVLSPPADLFGRAAALAAGPQRAVLGIVGPPGAGKSSLAAAVVDAVGERAALVPMDGFHLADTELVRLHRSERKGAPDTFDAHGYVHLLGRLVSRAEDVVYAPVFLREIGKAEAGALPIPRDVSLIVTEGNYLLCDGPFAPVRRLLTECWYVDLDPAVRRRRLVERHVRHGRTPEEAEHWVATTDEPNARLVESCRDRADVVLAGR